MLEKTANGLGFSISGGLFTEHIRNDHGIFVTKIIPGGSADLDGKLSVGDRLISVNDYSLEYVTHDDAVAAIASIVEQYNEIVLRVGKVTQLYSPASNNNQIPNASGVSDQQVLQQLQEITKLGNFFFIFFRDLFLLKNKIEKKKRKQLRNQENS